MRATNESLSWITQVDGKSGDVFSRPEVSEPSMLLINWCKLGVRLDSEDGQGDAD